MKNFWLYSAFLCRRRPRQSSSSSFHGSLMSCNSKFLTTTLVGERYKAINLPLSEWCHENRVKPQNLTVKMIGFISVTLIYKLSQVAFHLQYSQRETGNPSFLLPAKWGLCMVKKTSAKNHRPQLAAMNYWPRKCLQTSQWFLW